MIRNIFTTAALTGAISWAAAAQTTDVTTLLGKPLTDSFVANFIAAHKLDPATGLSYDNGIQMFNDGQTVYEIYLFNKTTLNGTTMQSYKGELPAKLVFADNIGTLRVKLGQEKSTNGDHAVWDMGTYMMEIAFTSDTKNEIAYIVLQKK